MDVIRRGGVMRKVSHGGRDRTVEKGMSRSDILKTRQASSYSMERTAALLPVLRCVENV